MANNYLKQFHIFKSMDNDVGNSSGYLKIEINGDIAKLQVSLNNLLQMQGILYQLYGIKKDANKLVYTVICDIPNINGRADVKISTNANQVGSSRLSLDYINIYAIVIQLPGKSPALKCPLVAYTKEEISWRNEFETAQNLHVAKNIESMKKINNTKDIENTNTNITEGEGFRVNADSIADDKIELTDKTTDTINEIEFCQDRDTPKEQVDNNKAVELNQLQNTDVDVSINERSSITDSNITINNIIEDDVAFEKENRVQVEATNIKKEANEIRKIEEVLKVDEEEQTKPAKTEEPAEEAKNRKKEDIRNSENYITGDNESVEKDVTDCNKSSEKDTADNNINTKVKDYRNNELLNDVKLNFTGKFESVITSLYNADKSALQGRERECEINSNDNDILGSVEENFKVISSIEIDKDKINHRLSLSDLKDELDKSFETYNPFKMKSKNFNWWKINSPGYLNNILFRNNIKTYLLFNPKVMLAHYKYRYIIFGIRKERHSGKEYFICGVPGVYSIDENPFGNIGSWAQTEGYKPKYGAFGYWIIMIEPKTGKLIKVK